MYAIVEIAGQQFKVAKDQKVYVQRLQQEEGKKVTFESVLLLEDGSDITIGAPAIDGAAVEAKVVKHLKGDKLIVFKKKRRKGYRKKNGHRQYLTELVIEGIVAKGYKKAGPERKKETEAGKEEAKAREESKKQTASPKESRKTKEEPKKTAAKAAAKPKKETAKPKKETAKKEKPAVANKAQDLNEQTVAELREMAKASGMEGYSSLKKAELIAAIKKHTK